MTSPAPTMLERAAWAAFRDHLRDARYCAGIVRDLKYSMNTGEAEDRARDYYAMARDQLHRIRAIRSGVARLGEDEAAEQMDNGRNTGGRDYRLRRVMEGTSRGAW